MNRRSRNAGTLELRGLEWYARVTISKGRRRWVRLGPVPRAVAEKRLAAIVRDVEAGHVPNPEAARAPETVAEASRRIVERQGREGLKTWRERLSRVERYAFPKIGELPITKVGPLRIRELLESAGRE